MVDRLSRPALLVVHEPRELPVVLSVEEVARLLDAAPGLKYKAALRVAYGACLRAIGNRENEPTKTVSDTDKPPCPCCGGRMIVIEVFERGATPRHRPTAPTSVIRIDTS